MRSERVIDTGEVIAGHYRVLERIGSGGMGVVWRARDERLQRVVAVKQLLLQPGLPAGDAESARQRTLREARIAARLQHPNAIVVFDVAEHDGEPCLVLEYMASRSLAAVLADRGALPAPEVAGIGRQIASALAAAHVAGIVHRDVKPGNVLIDDTGSAKITDFGVSRAAGDVTVTQTGVVAGTPAYLAPEVARGQEPTPASDVFSLGATLYAAVEGRTPFGDTGNQLALLHAAAAGRVEAPQRAGALRTVLMSMLQPDPGRRPDMAQAAAGLAAVTGADARNRPLLLPATAQFPADATAPIAGAVMRPGAGSTTRAMSPGPPGPPGPPPAGRPGPSARDRRRPRRLLVAAIVTAVLALGGWGLVSLLDGPSRPSGTPEAAGAPPEAGGASSSAAPSTTQPPTSSPAPSPAPRAAPDLSEGPIEWSAAGQLVIDYYNGLDDPESAWQMLSPAAQQSFGSQAAFREYWSRYERVSARNAQGVTVNDDGSVDVPVDVTYVNDGSSRQEQQVLRVTRIDGQLLIASEAR